MDQFKLKTMIDRSIDQMRTDLTEILDRFKRGQVLDHIAVRACFVTHSALVNSMHQNWGSFQRVIHQQTVMAENQLNGKEDVIRQLQKDSTVLSEQHLSQIKDYINEYDVRITGINQDYNASIIELEAKLEDLHREALEKEADDASEHERRQEESRIERINASLYLTQLDSLLTDTQNALSLKAEECVQLASSMMSHQVKAAQSGREKDVKIASLEEELQNLRTEFDVGLKRSRLEVHTLKEIDTQKSKSLADLQMSLKRLEEQNATIRNDLLQSTSTKSHYQQQINDLVSRLSESKRPFEQSNRNYEQIKTRLKDCEAELSEREVSNSGLNKRIDELTNTVDTHVRNEKSSASAYEQQSLLLLERTSERDQLSEQVQSLTADVAVHRESIGVINQECLDAEGRVSEIKISCEKHLRARCALLVVLIHQINAATGLEKTIATETSHSQALRTQVKTLEQRLHEGVRKLQLAESDELQYRRKLDALDADLKSKETDLQSKDTEITRLSDALSGMRQLRRRLRDCKDEFIATDLDFHARVNSLEDTALAQELKSIQRVKDAETHLRSVIDKHDGIKQGIESLRTDVKGHSERQKDQLREVAQATHEYHVSNDYTRLRTSVGREMADQLLKTWRMVRQPQAPNAMLGRTPAPSVPVANEPTRIRFSSLARTNDPRPKRRRSEFEIPESVASSSPRSNVIREPSFEFQGPESFKTQRPELPGFTAAASTVPSDDNILDDQDEDELDPYHDPGQFKSSRLRPPKRPRLTDIENGANDPPIFLIPSSDSEEEEQFPNNSSPSNHQTPHGRLGDSTEIGGSIQTAMLNPAPEIDVDDKVDTLWSMFIPAWAITGHEILRLENQFKRMFARKNRSLDSVIEAVDMYVLGDRNKSPPSPNVCLMAAITRSYAGQGGSTMCANNCPYCKKSKSRSDGNICCWAEYVPNVQPGCSAARVNNRIAKDLWVWAKPTQSLTRLFHGHNARWILRKRKELVGHEDHIDWPF